MNQSDHLIFSGRYYELVTTSSKDKETDILSIKEKVHNAKDIETCESQGSLKRKSIEKLPYFRTRSGN